MAGMIKSIFGLTTEDVREQQRQQQQKLATQLIQQGTSPFAASFGTAFGGELGRGLMSRLGIQDPAMAKAQSVEARQTALNEQLAALSPDDPQRFYLIGQALVDAGDSAEASRYFALGRQAEALGRQTAMSEKEFELREQSQEALESQREQTNALSMFNSLVDNLTPVEEALKITKDSYPSFNISQSYVDAVGDGASSTGGLANVFSNLPEGTTISLPGGMTATIRGGKAEISDANNDNNNGANNDNNSGGVVSSLVDMVTTSQDELSEIMNRPASDYSGFKTSGEFKRERAIINKQEEIEKLKKQLR